MAARPRLLVSDGICRHPKVCKAKVRRGWSCGEGFRGGEPLVKLVVDLADCLLQILKRLRISSPPHLVSEHVIANPPDACQRDQMPKRGRDVTLIELGLLRADAP